MNKCVRCGKRLTKKDDEYFHSKCYDEQLAEEMILMEKESKEEDNEWNEAWRFKDNRGRDVFRNE